MDGNKFFDFVRSCLIVKMHPFDGTAPRSIAIMDNCSIHHHYDVKMICEEAGVLLIFLPI